MPENKLTFRNCIRELLGFVRPYRIRLSIALSTDRKIPATDFLQSIKRWQMPHLRLSSFLP